jgi:hypothetical protein
MKWKGQRGANPVLEQAAPAFYSIPRFVLVLFRVHLRFICVHLRSRLRRAEGKVETRSDKMVLSK